jgi:transposase
MSAQKLSAIAPPRTLARHHVGALPLLHALARRLGLKQVLARHVPSHGNDRIAVVDTLVLLSYNLALGKEPLYELAGWVQSLDRRPLGYSELEPQWFNDDRFARALDRLYGADRASLMTELVTACAGAFELDLQRIHNDSTTIKAHGQYPGTTRTGVALKKGHSKDHRPDLKQLVFSLSVSADGAVPVHHKVYAGNRTDDSTHIETWKTLRKITPHPDFLYVADAKLCTDEQLSFIVEQGGRAITIVPETWGEVEAFKTTLRTTRKAKREIWRRQKPGQQEQFEYFSVFIGNYCTRKRGYRLHWIYSSEKRQRDREGREARLAKAEQALLALNARLNTRNLKERQAIETAAEAIVEQYQVSALLERRVATSQAREAVQIGKGRPGKHTRYQTRIRNIYSLTWVRNLDALKLEARLDGIFPLLCTDHALTAKEVLQAYKYQPRLEKRFSQFKSFHHAAPLLFKKVHRIEANLFVFFIALMLQALLEREVRSKMIRDGLKSLPLYPEEREADRPTTNKIIDIFDRLSTYSIIQDGQVVEEFKDQLTDTQLILLRYLNISESEFWRVT